LYHSLKISTIYTVQRAADKSHAVQQLKWLRCTEATEEFKF